MTPGAGREILSVRRLEDNRLAIYLDGDLWGAWTEEELRTPAGLLVKVGRAMEELMEHRLAARAAP